MTRKFVFLLIIVALALSVFTPVAKVQASTKDNTFNISIYNAIRATTLGYPQNYQFVFSIYTNGYLARQFLLRQGQRVDAVLPAGRYAFKLSDREGVVLARQGYRQISTGARVRWQSNLGPPDLAPTVKIRIF